MLRLGWQHLALLVIAAVAVPADAAAQVRLEVGPVFGGYIPAGSLRPADQFSPTLPTAPGDLGALAWGIEGRLWLGPRTGIEFLGVVARSRFGGGLVPPCGQVPSICGAASAPNHATIAVGTAQVMFRPAARGPLTVSAGFGLVRHGGDAYASFNAPTPLAAVGGLVLDLPLARRLNATLGVTALVYSLDVRDPLGSYQRGTQVDLVPHLSLTWTTHPT